jgi:exopolyphosphatase/guanosine-5'-triphosphate,3'-diphosphate pyrophosphatase
LAVPPDQNSPVAALDCGTNSTRLLIISGDGETLSRLMRITRLGQGVDATQHLDETAIQRTVDVLADYRRQMDEFGVGRARLVATSAVRDAENGQQFLDAATEVIRAQAEVLSGSEEGRLSYAGATMGLAPCGGDDVVVDIGGGSTELVVDVDGLVAAVSLDIGCVRVTERYLTDDPPEPDQVGAATEGITEALRTAGERIPRLRSLREPRRLIGLAGTVSTLAMLELGMADYERDLVHHAELSAASVERWSSGLLRESVRERLSHPGLPEGRADVIAAGALILHLAMSELSFESCLVSESDILDGLVASIRS